MGRLKKNEYKCSTVAAWAPTDSEAAMRDDIEEDVCVAKLEVDTAMSKMLRIMLGNSSNQPIIHSTLRSKALAGAEGELSKYIVESALLRLVDQGLLTRHGYGNFALYTIQQDAVHEATELAYLEFSTEDSATYSIEHYQERQRHQHHEQQPIIFGNDLHQPLPIKAPPCSIFRPASPRPRSGRSYSGTEKMSSVLRRVRLNGKRGHTSTNSFNIEENQLSGGGSSGAASYARGKRARVARPPQFQSLLHVGSSLNSGSHNGPAPMSP